MKSQFLYIKTLKPRNDMFTCSYKKKDGSYCSHPPHPSSKERLCIFHEKLEEKDPKKCLKKFYELVEAGETNFEGFQLSNVSLIKKRFEEPVDFSFAVFDGTTDFRWAYFERGASFSQAKFRGDVDFRMAGFEKETNFGEVLFEGKADFRWARFGDYTYFWSSEIKKAAYFWKTEFEGDANFEEMKFGEECSFKDAVFKRNVNFEETKFLKDAIFTRVNCEGEMSFSRTRFQGVAMFDNCETKGYARFDNCHFLQAGNFTNTKFSSVSFVDSFFEKKANFNNSKIIFGNFKGADLRYVRFDGVELSNIIFEDAHLEDSYISRGHWKNLREKRGFFYSIWKGLFPSAMKIREEREMEEGTHICSYCGTVDLKKGNFCEGCLKRFVDSLEMEFSCPQCGGDVDFDLLMNRYCPKCEIKFSERKKWQYNKVNMLKRVENVYRDIKQSLQREGDYEKAGEFYINEMRMKRLRYWERFRRDGKGVTLEEEGKGRYYYLWRWFKNMVIWLVTGYGEKPLRTVLTALFIIFFFASFYALADAVEGKGMGEDGSKSEMAFTEYIYFSVVTFTTLGYGDYSPRRVWYFQIAATMEAFLGAFMMALFIFVFTRKMTR